MFFERLEVVLPGPAGLYVGHALCRQSLPFGRIAHESQHMVDELFGASANLHGISFWCVDSLICFGTDNHWKAGRQTFEELILQSSCHADRVYANRRFPKIWPDIIHVS